MVKQKLIFKKRNYTMKKILFLQCSTNLINKGINKNNIASLYYEGIYTYKKEDGYYKGVDFWELPLWIAEISGLLADYEKTLHIVKDINETKNFLNNNSFDYILFSALDVNKNFYIDIVKDYKNTAIFLIGGYIDFSIFKDFNNVKVFESIPLLADFLKIDYKYNLDFSLFKGNYTIPRLTLSTGCKNHCKFCTIEKTIKEKSLQDVIMQAKSFEELNFKLIYLNDKTFGQAKNYNDLKIAYKIIKTYNKNFKGFIIQTTTAQILKKGFIEDLKNNYVVIVEIGIETYNNDLLFNLRKPQNTKTIDKAIELLHNADIKIIGNFIIGFINETKETYNNTLNFIKKNKEKLYILNIYNLALYSNAELAKEIKHIENDTNELIQEKSFYNDTQKQANNHFYNAIFKIGLRILKK